MIVKLNELDKIAITELNGAWLEPSKQRTDPYPKLIRRDAWLVKNNTTGMYFGRESEWVADPVQAWTCLWLANTILHLRHRFGEKGCRDLQLELVSFYCHPRTFPRGWFIADG